MDHSIHWHTITDCSVMGSYASKEQAEHAISRYMDEVADALVRRWTRELLDRGVVTFDMKADEVESWIVVSCNRPLPECDPPTESERAEGRESFGHPHRPDIDG